MVEPFDTNVFAAEVLCSLKRVPMPHVALAWLFVCAVVARWIGAHALIDYPEVVANPHLPVDLRAVCAEGAAVVAISMALGWWIAVGW